MTRVSTVERQRSPRTLLARCACLLLALAFSTGALAQPALEETVKAAYIYRFLEYVAWPPQAFRTPDEPLVIGTTHNDGVTAELSRIVAERTVHNRKLSVVVVKQVDRDAPVHVLYIPSDDAARLAKAAEVARQRPILIITDVNDGLEKGATINFVQSEGRIKFEVSLEAASRAGLTISSRLLAVATRVKKSAYRPATYARLDPAVAVIQGLARNQVSRSLHELSHALPRLAAATRRW